MSELLQILYPVSDRTVRVLTGASPAGGYPIETDINPYAGTHDGMDATKDEARDSGDGEAFSPSLVYAVDYKLSDAMVSGTIDSVVVRLREQHYTTAGQYTSGRVRPLIDGVERGTAVTTESAGMVWQGFIFTLDPADSTPWTNAKVNAKRWGFLLAAAGAGLFEQAIGGCSELYVEVWGSGASLLVPSLAGASVMNEGVIEAGSTAAGVSVNVEGQSEAGSLSAGVGVNGTGEVWTEE